jgi:hypothetical protein
VVIIAIEKLEQLQADREDARQTLEKIWTKTRGNKPEVVEKTVNEALRVTRNL